MPHDPDRVGSALLSYLTDADLAVLVDAGDGTADGAAEPRPSARRSPLLVPMFSATSRDAARSIAAIRAQPALVLDALGPHAALMLSSTLTALSLVALLALTRRVRDPGADRPRRGV